MESISDLIKDPKKFADDLKSRHKYVTQEFQDYGYRLAVKLGDTKNASMYIKMAKERERALLEQALSFTIDYPNAKSKPRLFLWKLKQLQDERDKKLGKMVKPSVKKAGKKSSRKAKDNKKSSESKKNGEKRSST
jgi:hypothetical protein